MALDPLIIAPTVYPYRALVQLEDTAGLARQVTFAASDVTVTIGPVYKADQISLGCGSLTWDEATLDAGTLPIPGAVTDGQQVMLLDANLVDAAYQPPGQAARNVWIAPDADCVDGWVQIGIDRGARGML